MPAQQPSLPELVCQFLPLLPDTGQLISCISRYTCQVPHLMNRDKATLRKPINSQDAAMAGLLAGQSTLSMTVKAAGWQTPHLLGPPAISAAPPEQWDQDAHTAHSILSRLAEMSHHCRQTWEAAEPPVQGGHPHLGAGPQAMQGRGAPCAGLQGCSAKHRPEVEEREETVAKAAQGTGGSQDSTTGIQGTDNSGLTCTAKALATTQQQGWTWQQACVHPPIHFLSETICFPPTAQPLEKQVHPRSTFGFFKKQFFLLIARKSESVTAAQASPVSASTTCPLQQPWTIPRACFTLCLSAW